MNASRQLSIAVLTALLVSGCGTASSSPSTVPPTAEPTTQPSATVRSSSIASSTAAPSPSATGTPRQTEAPTLTPATTATPAPTVTATPSPTGPANHIDVGMGFVAPDGTIYFADCGTARLVRVNQAGAEEVIAGTGPGGFSNGFSGDGGPATEAHMGCARSPVMDAQGNIYIVDHLNHRIRKIDTNGIITTVVGSGEGHQSPDDDGDGLPATQAHLNFPSWLILDSAGNLYISDRDNDRVWKVSDDNILRLIAGTGENGLSGDGGPATQASFDDPEGLAIAQDGSIFVSDDDNARIRRIDTNGVITTIAGTGKLGSTGDGGPAKKATFELPNDLLFDAAGNLYVNESNRIRRIDPNGTISAFAGTGAVGSSGDGGPAVNATFTAPTPFIDAHGTFWIFDGGNNCVRRIDDAGIISTYWCVDTGFTTP